MDVTKELNSIIMQTVQVSPIMKIIKVKPDGWHFPQFAAGQFVGLGLTAEAKRCAESTAEHSAPNPEKLIKRAYSIASSSTDDMIEFYVTLVHSGQLTPRLFELKIGDRIWMGPKAVGMFTLDQIDQGANVVMVATGTGIAPYMSMLRTNALKRQGNIMVIHGAANSWDLGYSSELKLLASIFPNFSYYPTITEPDKEPAGWTGDTRFVQEIWEGGLAEKIWNLKPLPENTHFFLCGNPRMIDTMKELLAKDGFTEHNRKVFGQVHAEEF